MTKRFDRTSDGSKLHMKSLCAMAHMDFDSRGPIHFDIMRKLTLVHYDFVQMYKCMVFN